MDLSNSVEGILQTLGIPVRFIEADNSILYAHERGATYKVPNENHYSVFIRRDLPTVQRQKVLCHELGHIVLGHMTKERFPYMSVQQRESEAEQFASFVLPLIYSPLKVMEAKSL